MLEPSHTADERLEWYGHFGKQFGSPFKLNTEGSFYPSMWENMCSHKNLYVTFRNNTTYNDPKLETTKTFTGEW